MKKSRSLHTDPARPDLAAFDAGVRTRLAQRRTLPPDAIEGVERLGRLVQVLRIKQRWSLEALAAHTGLPWLWLALLEQGVLLPSELTPDTVQQLGQAFPLQHGGADPATLFHTLVEDFHPLSPAAQEPPASSAGQSAPPALRPTVAREPGSLQEEKPPPTPLRVVNTLGAGPEPRPNTRGFGGSTKPLEPIVNVRLTRAAAASETDAPIWIFPSDDGLVTATVRVLAAGEIAVAIETKDPQHAASQWSFRFAREADDMALCSGTLTLVAAEPGFWEGRVELTLPLPDPWSFKFFPFQVIQGGTP